MEESKNSPVGDAAVSKRRRRRSAVPVEAARPAAAGRDREVGRARARSSLWQRWGGRVSSFGLSSGFRAYLFVGSIIAILAYLLHTETVIREFREQEKGRVQLYAYLYSFAASPLATPEQSELIFKEVITNPRGDFPIIVTDRRGNITDWKGEGLPAPGDTSAAAVQTLRAFMVKMDVQNTPEAIASELDPFASARLHHDGANFVIADRAGDIVGWWGEALPAEDDTSAAARAQVREMMQRMGARIAPRSFQVPADSICSLYTDGANFIVVNSASKVVEWWGEDLPDASDASAAALARVREAMLGMGSEHPPYSFRILSESLQYIHYGDSALVSRLERARMVLTGVLLLFVLIGYVGFRNIKRSEQRSIWMGMAKETAHQLGTPLSSLSGWLELITYELGDAPNGNAAARMERLGQHVVEMQKDMQRLNRIASRFSQIGSVPELKSEDVKAVLTETGNYFRNRGPQFGRHNIKIECQEVPLVPMNAELISWAFENLFKNGMDAIGRETGAIEIHVHALPDQQAVQIFFQDNGRGIEPEHVNRVFEPGFSTKKRGWGLGLAFVKRIVEEYHRGRIRLVRSVPGEGTMFEIILPAG